MHINTCKAIKDVLERVVIQDRIQDIDIDNKEARGDSFYKMLIKVKRGQREFLPRLRELCREIGWMNGEGLWTDIKNRELILR